MGVFTFENEYTSVVAPHRLFKAFVLDADNLFPKALPDSPPTVEILHGDGGPGTIKKIHFGHESIKHRIDAVDEANFEFKYSIIEGDKVGDQIELIENEIKIVASGTGSVLKGITKFHAKAGVEIKEEDVKEGKQKAEFLFRAAEAYLVANPHAY